MAMESDGLGAADGSGISSGWHPEGLMAGMPEMNATAVQGTLPAVMTPEQMVDVDWGDMPPPMAVNQTGGSQMPWTVSGQDPRPELPSGAAQGAPMADQIDPNDLAVAQPPQRPGAAAGPSDMTISDRGKSFMQGWEQGPDGGAALKPYPSAEGGAPTIGWGHKIQPGEDFSGGITQQQADQLFDKDIGAAQKRVQNNVRVPLSQQQYDALVSLAYNSPKAVTDSTLLSKLNGSDYAGAGDQFQVWNKGGRPLQAIPGLTSRRAGEADIFTNGVYTNHN